MSSNNSGGRIRYFVNDTSGKTFATAGRAPARQALEDGFREVTQEQYRQFTEENARLLQAVIAKTTSDAPLKEGVEA